MANRINRNLRWVKRQLDLAKATDILEEEILDAMSHAELDIMEQTGSVKNSTTITFDSTVTPVPPVDQSQGIYAFPVGADRINYLQYPDSWTRPLRMTEDPKVFDDIKKANIAGSQPLVAFVYADLIQFWPIPTDGETITFYYGVTPTDAQAQVEGTGDPILSKHWDLCLRYRALSILIGGDWEDKYQKEYLKEAHHHLQNTGEPLLIDHSTRRLGF